jgi:tRNA threonylcarbamoyladenosine biosynthesis protein TsaB
LKQVILSLETSTDVCSVALYDNRRVLSSIALREPQAHASKLGPLIERAMRESHTSLKDLRAVAITNGPGSYTGLRIGTSTAKGLCYALDIPLISVGTLELLAFQGSAHNAGNALLCPMIDARRMEVYCLIADGALNILEPPSATVVDHNSFAELLSEHRVLFFGNGASKCREVIVHPNAIFVDDIFPAAASLAEMADKKYAAHEFEDLVGFKPFYLKEFAVKKSRAAQ